MKQYILLIALLATISCKEDPHDRAKKQVDRYFHQIFPDYKDIEVLTIIGPDSMYADFETVVYFDSLMREIKDRVDKIEGITSEMKRLNEQAYFRRVDDEVSQKNEEASKISKTADSLKAILDKIYPKLKVLNGDEFTYKYRVRRNFNNNPSIEELLFFFQKNGDLMGSGVFLGDSYYKFKIDPNILNEIKKEQ